jgi:hypothetical protein
VSAAGGWLQGGGLSFTSRKYGLGVDNVIDYRVVLADGTIVVADACKNTDLFYALRGGGGGTYGVVTHINYKVHPVTPIVAVDFGVYGTNNIDVVRNQSFRRIVKQWMTYWVEKSPTLDNNWCGGAFFHSRGHLLYCGTLNDARTSFLSEFENWASDTLDTSGTVPGKWDTYFNVQSYPSWYDYR